MTIWTCPECGARLSVCKKQRGLICPVCGGKGGGNEEVETEGAGSDQGGSKRRGRKRGPRGSDLGNQGERD